MGPIAEMLAEPDDGLQLLYITPLRALSRDIEQSIKAPIEEMDLGHCGWSRGRGIPPLPARPSSSSDAEHAHHHAGVLSVMLSYKDGAKRCRICAAWCWMNGMN
jgi:ATP-dependent Lhr-like helicase